ncbi:MAG: retropepsin-like aspartic protease [Lentimicrobiaceae bacterium]|nr:retropepsin-like aspartic protease [Lentimicrobiaceae bacterium]
MERINIALKTQKMKKIFILSLIISFLVPSLKSQVRIKMQREGGVYTMPCTVNGLKLRFIFDTGASNVSLSLSEAIFMLKNGYLEESDLHGSSLSQIANGDIIENTTVNLKEIEIGGIKIYNVEAAIIHNLSAPLLLGQSAINKLGKIQLDGDELLIIDSDIVPDNYKCELASSLIEAAKKHYYDDLYALAAHTYVKAYNLCPSVFSEPDICFMGQSYYEMEDYENSIKFLSMWLELTQDDDVYQYFPIMTIAKSYMVLENYTKAEIFYEKAFSIARDDLDRKMGCFGLGILYYKKKSYYKSIDHFNESLDYYLRYKNINDFGEVLRKAYKGEFVDKQIGEILYNIAMNNLKLGEIDKAEELLYDAGRFGHSEAKNLCKKYGISFKLVE